MQLFNNHQIIPKAAVPVVAAAVVCGVLGAAVGWMAMGGGSTLAPPPKVEVPAVVPVYPREAFSTTQPDRRVVFSDNGNSGQIFVGLDVTQITSASTATEAVLQRDATKEALIRQGYAWSAEGLMNAARKGDKQAEFTYVSLGMAVDTQNAFGSTALYAAAESNQPGVVKLLIAAGANPNLANTQNMTPLMRAVEQNLPGMVELLMALGADPQSSNSEGWNPLFYAVQSNNAAMVERLITGGLDPNGHDRLGLTPLMVASRKGSLDMVRLLVKQGADVNAVDAVGVPALHGAVKEGNFQMVKLLLENGAKVDASTRSGTTAMDVALAQNDMTLANLLLAHGAKRPGVLGRE
ncbi:MAG: ankyrin repeat domain-containing protein [Alphaproteobacteria bacterium]